MTQFKDKTLLITGGTGSFGNAVLNRFLETNIKEIRVFSRDELKQDNMRHEYQAKYPDVFHKLKFYIGDVRDLHSIKNAMHGVDYVYHAAALKQVPSCEFFPIEAVKTNVLGTENVLTAAIECGVKRVVCLSTDKAAYPVNAMGTSKAMMEKVIVAKSRTVDPEKTAIMCTRYGNFPIEAVKTNVLGTENVLTAAIECGVKRVVCLSTDKAAYPVNAMGTSKAMMEKVIVAKSRTVDPEKTAIMCTRYGNVLASRGSVVTLFINQIKEGNDLTVTDPTTEMTRIADTVLIPGIWVICMNESNTLDARFIISISKLLI